MAAAHPVTTHTTHATPQHVVQPLPVQRTCANCGCAETPLWRRSPLGPKTLCNACGVRMKKGRLVFVLGTGRFMTVESPAAIAKRQRKEKELAERAAHASHGMRNGSTLQVGHAAGIPSYPTQQAVITPRAATLGKNSGIMKNSSNRKKKSTFKNNANGLDYLLQAIEFVEAL